MEKKDNIWGFSFAFSKSEVFCFVFFLAISFTSFSQTSENKHSDFDQQSVSLDSAVNWLQVNRTLKDNNFEVVAAQVLSRAKNEEDFEKLARIRLYMSNWHYMNNTRYGADSIIYNQEQSIEYFKKAGNLQAVNESYIWVSTDYISNGEPEKAESLIFKAIDYFEQTNNESWLAEAHAQLASLYVYVEEYKKAIDYSQRCYPILLNHEEYVTAGSVLLLLCDAYRNLKEYDNALKNADICIDLALTNSFVQDKDLLVAAYAEKGDIYSSQKKYAAAQNFYEKAWKENIALEGKEGADYYRFNIGSVLFHQKKYKEALQHLTAGIKAIEHAEVARTPENYLVLSRCYEELGAFKDAFNARDTAMALQKKLAAETIDHLRSEMAIKYETEKKDEQISLKEEQLRQESRFQKIMMGVAVVLVFLLLLLFYFLRKNQRTKKNLQKKNQENELLLKEIHHRVKNNLEMVKSLIALQSAQVQEGSAKEALIASQNRVQSMGIIHQKLYQGTNLGSIEMKDYFINLSEGILDSFNAEEKVKIQLVMEELDLDIDTAVPIGLIVNELLTNSLKYAFPERNGEIIIKMNKVDDQVIRLQVSDDGVGKPFLAAAKGTGFGTQLIQLLTLQLNGKMEEKNSQGTSVSFEFNLDRAA